MGLHRFRILNVFTRPAEPLSGNPLCVFEDGSGLDSGTMQALARQFNLSETTFILASSRADARVRIFTPDYEMPFAGHPTLGTAFVCRALGLGGPALRLETQAGIIPVSANGDRWTLTAPTPRWHEPAQSPALLADWLGLNPADVGERPLWVNAGTLQLIVPLNSVEAVRRSTPRGDVAGALARVDVSGIYVFASHAPGRTVARFLFRQNGTLLEDPATGSATANFGGWCLAMRQALPLQYEISQGEQVQRPSILHLAIDAAGAVRVGGEVTEIGGGVISLS